MRKTSIIFATLCALALTVIEGCNKTIDNGIISEERPGTSETDNPETDNPGTELSKDGVANCYVIDKAGNYSFIASDSAVGADAAALVWESTQGMITDIKFENGKDGGIIRFVASSKAGNALICATKDGVIIWSWHIWHPKSEIKSLTADNGYSVMNMNLGAMSDAYKEGILDTYGLLYQWGRKDPLPGSPSVTGTTSTMPMPVYDSEGKPVSIGHTSWTSTECNTMEYAIAHPTTVISNYSQYSNTRDWLKVSDDNLWGCPEPSASGSKSVHDPCPAGWRVPPADAFRYATTSGGYSEDRNTFRVEGEFTNGWLLILDPEKGVKSFFPAAGRYDGQYAMLYGSIAGLWGNYWGNAPYSGEIASGMGYSVLSFQQKSISPAAGGSRADAYSVRCIAE